MNTDNDVHDPFFKILNSHDPIFKILNSRVKSKISSDKNDLNDNIKNSDNEILNNDTKNIKEFNNALLHTIISTEISLYQQKVQTPVKLRVWEYDKTLNIRSNCHHLLQNILKAIKVNIGFVDDVEVCKIDNRYINSMYEASMPLLNIEGFDLEHVHPKEYILSQKDLHFGMMSLSSVINYCKDNLTISKDDKVNIHVMYNSYNSEIMIVSNNHALIKSVLSLILSGTYNINITGYSISNNTLILKVDKHDEEFINYNSFACEYII